MRAEIYSKRGRTTYQEEKLIKALTKVLNAKRKVDPNFKFDVVHSIDELKYLHDQHCIEDATIISETPHEEVEIKDSNISTNQNDNDMAEETTTEKGNNFTNPNEFQFETPDFETPDPFNEKNPKVRDYVLKDSMSPDGQKRNEVGSTASLSEPTDHNSAFAFPDDYDNDKKGNNKQSSSEPKKEKEEKPFNPGFDDMNGQKKSRQTKRFAKHIVEAVAMGLEFGFVWWTTKDINESALASYGLNDEMDLDLLLSMDEGQEITVRQFFADKCDQAREQGKISQEDKEDLADALADVLLEKGIAPTPVQTLIMVSLKVIGGQVMKAVVVKAEVGSVLNQLRSMHQSNPEPQIKEVRQERQSEAPSQSKTEAVYTPPLNDVASDEEADQILRQIEKIDDNDTNMSMVKLPETEDVD